MSRPAALTLRIYRALARAFPQEFKNVYGDDLVQAAEDAVEPIWRHYGVLGLVRLLIDIALRIPVEYAAELRQDTRFAVRMLAGSPGFTAVALISLGLGICAPTCLYSELNGTIGRNIAGVAAPDELVTNHLPISYPVYTRFRERGDLFSDTLAYIAPVPFGVALGGRAERTWGHLVTPSYFAVLGVRPAIGRVFEGDGCEVVVSDRLWRNRLGGDRRVIGRTLRINGHPCTVAGVGPKDFLGASPMFFMADLWVPIAAGERIAPELSGNALERRDLAMFQFVGRLKPGITPLRAEAELDTVARQLEDPADRTEKGRRVHLKAGGRVVPTRQGDMALVMILPVVVMALVLLIACSNVANMALARAVARRKEIAIRLALGASRARLIRQLLTESMLVAAGAGLFGFLLTASLMRLLAGLRLPHAMPVTFQTEVDLRVFAFTLALTAFAGLAFGLAPAFHATRVDLTPALKEGGAVRLRRFRRLGLRNMLVLYQMAASLTLLLVTGTIVLAFHTTAAVDSGLDVRNVHLMALDPIRDGYSSAQARVFFEKLLERVRGLRAIRAAALAESAPMMPSGRVSFSSAGAVHSATKYVAGKDYFETTGIRILAGRGFRKDDETAVIVTEKLVREFWGGQDAVGRRLEIARSQALRFDPIAGSSLDYRPKDREVFEVVGVAQDVMESAMERARPAVYFPLRPSDYALPVFQGVTLIVRGAPGVDVVRAVRREISAIDAAIEPFNVRSMQDHIDTLNFPIEVGVWSYGMLGVFGLVLATAGLAGVTAYSVARRVREIGIRIALGAGRGDVLRLVLNEGAVLVAAGTVIGLAGAWAFTRALSASMDAVSRVVSRATTQPLLFVAAPLLLGLLALAACYVPARKSLRIDPVVALRQE